MNVSTDELSNDDFIAQVIELTKKSGTPPGLLRLEVKEGDAARDIELLYDRIDRLSAAGIGVALDDFGRNHSALSLVGSHRFDILKMNDAYTHSVSAPLRRQLLSILIDISRQVGFSIVLEGVETPEHDKAVQDLGIRYIQGHFIAKPIPETEVMDWVARYDERGGGKQPRLRAAHEAIIGITPGIVKNGQPRSGTTCYRSYAGAISRAGGLPVMLAGAPGMRASGRERWTGCCCPAGAISRPRCMGAAICTAKTYPSSGTRWRSRQPAHSGRHGNPCLAYAGAYRCCAWRWAVRWFRTSGASLPCPIPIYQRPATG